MDCVTSGKVHAAPGRGARLLRGPILWSATAHLLAAFSLLVLAADPATGPFREVVEVFLVGSNRNDRDVPKRPVPLPASGELQVPASDSLPKSLKEIPDPGAAATDTLSGLSGEMPSSTETGSGPNALSPDAGESSREVAESERAAVFPPPGMETGWSGGQSGPVPAGPSTSFPDPDRAEMFSRGGAGMDLLRERIQSRIVYPEEAVRRGQQGEVLLRIRIASDGVPREIRIARSSGVRLLDDAARRGVVRAAPLPSPPGWVEVPVHFRLR